jgi:hypothetical protein
MVSCFTSSRSVRQLIDIVNGAVWLVIDRRIGNQSVMRLNMVSDVIYGNRKVRSNLSE